MESLPRSASPSRARRWYGQFLEVLGYLGGEAQDYRIVSVVFLRLLALIYLIAFVSIGVQILGLVGAQGILPIREHLDYLGGAYGPERFWLVPTIFWLNASDWALQAAWMAGCIFALLLLFDRLARLSLVMLFILYLSLTHAGQLFMNFQWDYLLLEAGFLAIFLPGRSRLVVWLFRWLLFRLRFLSGASKLLSGDASWSSFTALHYYFETQPLPTPLAWYVHQAPDWLLRTGVGATFFVELIVPFFMLLPRPFRLFAAAATVLMQLLIMLTSNHNFFNLLTILLCLFLIDDRALGRLLPTRLRPSAPQPAPDRSTAHPGRNLVLATMGSLLALVSLLQMGSFLSRKPLPGWAQALVEPVSAFRIVNKYHVFPVINTQRLELVIEGSADGEHWQPYVFRYRPGDPSRRPGWVIPHQPRLDWMMWFVPAGHPLNLMWFDRFAHRLLENARPVIRLLEHNPFPDAPPEQLRITLYRYRFTDCQTRSDTGDWWTREDLGPFWALPRLYRQRPAVTEGPGA
jgi:hypothetical protein